MKNLTQFYREEDSGAGSGTGVAPDVVVELDEAPPVTPSGTVGQPSEAETIAFAESLLRGKGYNVSRETPQGALIPGTDIPADMHPEWEDYTNNEKHIAKVSWESAKRMAQASSQQAKQNSAPLMRSLAIAQISEGLDAREQSALKKAIAEMEAEDNAVFAPDKVTPSMVKQWHRIAKGTALEGPPAAPKVTKEPPGDGKVESATQEEQMYMDEAKRTYGTELTLEQARAVMSNGKTQGYVMGAGGKN